MKKGQQHFTIYNNILNRVFNINGKLTPIVLKVNENTHKAQNMLNPRPITQKTQRLIITNFPKVLLDEFVKTKQNNINNNLINIATTTLKSLRFSCDFDYDGAMWELCDCYVEQDSINNYEKTGNTTVELSGQISFHALNLK